MAATGYKQLGAVSTWMMGPTLVDERPCCRSEGGKGNDRKNDHLISGSELNSKDMLDLTFLPADHRRGSSSTGVPSMSNGDAFLSFTTGSSSVVFSFARDTAPTKAADGGGREGALSDFISSLERCAGLGCWVVGAGACTLEFLFVEEGSTSLLTLVCVS
jgi:hypothetical protein